jgi:hypothetical protein
VGVTVRSVTAAQLTVFVAINIAIGLAAPTHADVDSDFNEQSFSYRIDSPRDYNPYLRSSRLPTANGRCHLSTRVTLTLIVPRDTKVLLSHGLGVSTVEGDVGLGLRRTYQDDVLAR